MNTIINTHMQAFQDKVDNYRTTIFQEEVPPLWQYNACKVIMNADKTPALYEVGDIPVILECHLKALMQMATKQDIESFIIRGYSKFKNHRPKEKRFGIQGSIVLAEVFLDVYADEILSDDDCKRYMNKLCYSKVEVLFYHYHNRLQEAQDIYEQCGTAVNLKMIDRAKSAGWTEGEDLIGYV